MKHINFWFDPVSPYAYLGFEQLPQALEGLSYDVSYRPILFAGLLKVWGQKGPAEIEPKRAWTFRQVHWQAHELGLPIDTPASHPFNPLPLLRLLVACAPQGGWPNRRSCEIVLRHVWRGGHEAADPQRLATLAQTLNPPGNPDDPWVKQSLREATDQAAASGIFGVPTFECEGRTFWGADSLPMLRRFLQGDDWFQRSVWEDEGKPRQGVRR